MKAVIYVRVSTDRQDEQNQVPDCWRLCQARGWEASTAHETASGAAERPMWARVLELAHEGKVNAVVIWSLDRIGRRMWEVIRDIQELDRIGCAVVSVRETWLDTTGPTRGLLLAIFAWVSEHERERLRERTIAGIARARAQGKRLGRPGKLSPTEIGFAVGLKREGKSWEEVRQMLKLRGTEVTRSALSRTVGRRLGTSK